MKAALVLGALLFATTAGEAGECKVTGVHLCCRACVVAVNEALSDVEGVTAAACDEENGIVTFQATNTEAANRGLAALAQAGFHGQPKFGDEEVAFPASGIEEGETSNSSQFTQIHWCCPGCGNAIEAAVKEVSGVTGMNWNRQTKILTVTGNGFSLQAVCRALNEAGFHCAVKRDN